MCICLYTYMCRFLCIQISVFWFDLLIRLFWSIQKALFPVDLISKDYIYGYEYFKICIYIGFSKDLIKVIFKVLGQKFIFKSFTGSKPKLWPRNCYELVFQFWPSIVTSHLWPRNCDLVSWPHISTWPRKACVTSRAQLQPRELMTT